MDMANGKDDGNKVYTVSDYILAGKDVKWKNFKVVDTNIELDHRLIKAKYLSMVTHDQNFRYYMRNKDEKVIFCIEEYEDEE